METMYDQWLRQEKQKIHDKYEGKRDKLRGEAFTAGLSTEYWRQDPQEKKRNLERADKMKLLDAEESKEADDFMRMIEPNWNAHVNDVMGNK